MRLIEQILDRSNVRVAVEKVTTNNGAARIDGMKVGDFRDYMNSNWTSIKESILARRKIWLILLGSICSLFCHK